jgi:phage head maturation protease
VELFDVAPVTFPAYPETDVAVRGRDIALESLKAWRAAQPAGEEDLDLRAHQRRLRLAELS